MPSFLKIIATMVEDTCTSSIIGAVVLALRIQEALPVVCLISLLRVCVNEDLDVPTEKARSNLEDQEVFLLDHDAGERANDGRRGAPIDELPVVVLKEEPCNGHTITSP